MRTGASVIAAMFCLVLVGAARVGEMAPDFPPGAFLDGRTYSLRDFSGQVIVLIFYDADCPKYRASIAERARLIELYRNKPIRFFAIAAGDTVAQARAYAAATGQSLPTFIDNISLMERQYGAGVSRSNGMQVRIIGADGKLLAGRELIPDALDAALDDARHRYKGQGYDSRLDPAIDCFEAGQYADGMRLLKPLLRSSRGQAAESARKLLGAVTEEAQGWMSQAESAAAERPCEAYDLLQKAAGAFAGEELGRRAQDAMRKLSTNPLVKDELAARQLWQRLSAGILKATPKERDQIKDFAAEIARLYSKTPTGEKAAQIVRELM